MKTKLYQTIIDLKARKARAMQLLREKRGDFLVDHAAVAIIIVVVAALALGLLTGFINTDFAPKLKENILGLFG